jgi:hypothetical protein
MDLVAIPVRGRVDPERRAGPHPRIAILPE